MDIRKYLKTQREQAEQQEGDDEVSSRKKQKTESDDSVVIENRPYDTSSSSDIANTPSVENEVKQDDTATGEVDGPNMSHKYSSDSDIGLYINSAKQISDDVKYNLLMNHFKPTETYDFKADASGRRSFRHPWLSRYSPFAMVSILIQVKGSNMCLLHSVSTTC